MTEERADGSFLDRIDLFTILRDLVRQWWVIVLLALSAGMIAGTVVEVAYVPQYTTSATFLVTTKGTNNSISADLSTTASLAEQLTFVLQSSVLEKKVVNDLGLDSLDAEMSAEQVSGTNIITLTVTADAPMMAYRVIESVIENYDQVSAYVDDTAVLKVLVAPSVPTGPSNGVNTSFVVKRARQIGAVAAAALVALLSYLRDTVKNEREFSRKVDARRLGTVVHERKSRRILSRKKRYVSMLITNPLRSFRYVETSRIAASKIQSNLDKDKKKVVLFTSVTENEGKSTVAANVALALAQGGSRVALVDCDFRKPSQYKLFQIPKREVQDLIKVLKTGEDTEYVFGRQEDSGLYTVFNREASGAEESQADKPVFQALMQFCREKMDYVILDTAPMALVSDTEELAQQCDASVLVVRQDVALAKDINDVIDLLNNTNGKLLGCVYNDVDRLFSSVQGGYGGRYGYGGQYGNYGKQA